MSRVTFLSSIFLLLSLAFNGISQEKKNILFIAVDDLKPMLGCYGDETIHTPSIDKLAQSGTVFTNAHCQQAVCGPSRASLMTGMRPDYTKVWDLKTRMRDINPNILAMPEHFKAQGYTTLAIGKIYDPRCVDKQYDGHSWSIPYKESAEYTYPKKYGKPGLSFYASKENNKIVDKYTKEAISEGVKNIHSYVAAKFKPSTESADVDDAAHMDTQIANNAIRYMKELSKKDKPFFLAVGFKKPHLPFAAPKKYWDLYEREKIELAPYRAPVKNGVDFAYHTSGELKSYTDIPALASFSDIFNDNLPEWKQKELIHGYKACVSFIDAQVGRMLDALKQNGLDKNTVIVLWGDHGWHLGDHSMWCKHSNFEQATRVPLVFASPNGKTGIQNASPVEFIDIFPTLCELSGVPVPPTLDGQSLAPILSGNSDKVKDFAISQYPRGKRMGYSLRNERYRYTAWFEMDFMKGEKAQNEKLIAEELYDYEKDPNETQNLVEFENHVQIHKELSQQLSEFLNK